MTIILLCVELKLKHHEQHVSHVLFIRTCHKHNEILPLQTALSYFSCSGDKCVYDLVLLSLAVGPGLG